MNQVAEWQAFSSGGGVDRRFWPLAVLVVLVLWPALAYGLLGKAWSDVPQ